MITYIATYRVVFEAQDDMQAALISDMLMENAKRNLDEEEGDTIELTQLTDFPDSLAPEETIVRLCHARNLLIKTRLKYAYDQAKELDKVIWSLKNRDDLMLLAGYDYGRFFEIASAILNKGENPLY